MNDGRETTDRQRKLIAWLQVQLQMTDAEVDEFARKYAGTTRDTTDRKAASHLIFQLQRYRDHGEDWTP